MTKQAVLIAIVDCSGSMGKTKRNIAKQYYNLFKGMVLGKYDEVMVESIAHNTKAYVQSSDTGLFDIRCGGGTYISCGYDMALELIDYKYNPSIQDIYILHISDGDNWKEDNPKAISKAKKLLKIAHSFQLIEVRNHDMSALECFKELLNYDNYHTAIFKFDNPPIFEFLREINRYIDSEIGIANRIAERDDRRISLNKDIKKITRNKYNTTVQLKTGEVGQSICHNEDEYDEGVGFRLAYLRAIQDHKENLAKPLLEEIFAIKKEIAVLAQ